MPQKDPVYVELKDFFFGQPRFNFKGQQDLGKFSEKGLIQRQEIVTRHLHGERGSATAFFTGQEQLGYRPHQAQRFDAAVFKESVVFSSQ